MESSSDGEDPPGSSDKERIKLDVLQEIAAGESDRLEFTKRDQVESSDIPNEDPNVFEVRSDEQPSKTQRYMLTSKTEENPVDNAVIGVIKETLTNGVIPKPPEAKKLQRDILSWTPRNRKICVRKDERKNDDDGKVSCLSNSVDTLSDPKPTLPISSNDNCSTIAALSERKGEVQSRVGSGDSLDIGINQKEEESHGEFDQPAIRATNESLDRSSSVSARQNYCQSNSTEAKAMACKSNHKKKSEDFANMDICKADIVRAQMFATYGDLTCCIQTPLPTNSHSDHTIRSSFSDTSLLQQRTTHRSHSDTTLTTRDHQKNAWEMCIQGLKSPICNTLIEQLQNEFETGSLEEFEKLEEMFNRSPDNQFTSDSIVGTEPRDPSNKHRSTVKIRSLEEFQTLESMVCKSPCNRRMSDVRETKELKLPVVDNGNDIQTSIKVNERRTVATLKNLSTNCLLATKKTLVHWNQLTDGVTIQRSPKSAGSKEDKISPPTANVICQNDEVPNLSSKYQKKGSIDQPKNVYPLEQAGKDISQQSVSKSCESTRGSGRNTQATEDSECDVDTKEFLAKVRSHKKKFRYGTHKFKDLDMGSVKVMQVIEEGKVKMFALQFHRDTDQDLELKVLIREARRIRRSCRAFKYRGARLVIEQEMRLKGSSIPIFSTKRRAHKMLKPSKIPVPIQPTAKSRPASFQTNILPFNTKQKLIPQNTSVVGMRPSKIPILDKVWIKKPVRHQPLEHPYVASLKRSRIPVKRRSTLKGKVGFINITGLKIKKGDNLSLRKSLGIVTLSKRRIDEQQHEAVIFKKLMENFILQMKYKNLYRKQRSKHFDYHDDNKDTLGAKKGQTLLELYEDGFVAELLDQKGLAVPQQNLTKQKCGEKQLTQGVSTVIPNCKEITVKELRQNDIIPKLTGKEQLQLQAWKEKQLAAKPVQAVEEELRKQKATSITSLERSSDVSPSHTITNQVKTAPVKPGPNNLTEHQEQRSSDQIQKNENNFHLANGEPFVGNARSDRPAYKNAIAWEINWTNNGSPGGDKQMLSRKVCTSFSGVELGIIRPSILKIKSETPSIKKSVSWDLTLNNNETHDEDTQKVLGKTGISSSDAQVDTIRTVAKRNVFSEIKPRANNPPIHKIQGTSQNKEVLKLPPLNNKRERSVFYSFGSNDGNKMVPCPPYKKTEERVALPKINITPSSNSTSVDRYKAAINVDILPSLPQIKTFSKPGTHGISKRESNVPRVPSINHSEDKFVPLVFRDNVGHENSVKKQEKDTTKFKKTKQSRNAHVERMKAGQEKRRQKAEIPIPWFHRD